MKLIVAGATGFVGTELVRQALDNPAVTSLIALARTETVCPPHENATKFTSVVCKDFINYPEDVKKKLEGADACVWLIAVTPSRLNTMPFEEVLKISLDFTQAALETMSAVAATPFRFIYCSGVAGERDQTKRHWIMPDLALARGKAETITLDYAAASKGKVEACITKPGMIAGKVLPWKTAIAKTMIRFVVGLPRVEVTEIAACMLSGVIEGLEKDTYENEDLVRIGRAALEKYGA
jgi:nucleoside-diphosphate-sugar epimerase